jgi:hypothetical protein
MTVSAKQFDNFVHELGHKTIDLVNDTVKIALYTSAHAPGQADVDTSGLTEVTQANGYTTGGATIGSKTWANAGHVTTFDGADPSWGLTGAGITWRYAVYTDTTASKVISYIDMGADQVWATPGTYGLTLDAAGIARVTVS